MFTWSASGTIITEALVSVFSVTWQGGCGKEVAVGQHVLLIKVSFTLCFQASSFPSVVVYVMDTSRSTNPITFMSNMLYACR